MFDFETTVAGIEHKVRLLADEVARLRTALYEKEDQLRDMEKALENKEHPGVIYREPSFLIIICGNASMAYTTKNGVKVIPIGCLKD